MAVISTEQARLLNDRVNRGEFDEDPNKKARAQSVIQSHVARMRRIREAPQEEHKDVPIQGAFSRVDEALATGTSGTVQLAGTILTGAVGQIAGGLAGALHGFGTLFTDKLGGAEDVFNTFEAVSDAFTLDPITESGTRALQAIAPPLTAVDNGVDYIATKVGFGNEIARSAIYSTIMGATEFFGIKKGGVLRMNDRLRNAQGNVQQIATELGIDITNSPSTLPTQIIEAVSRMTPNERGANTPALKAALQKAEIDRQGFLDEALASARETNAFVHAKDSTTFSNGLIPSLRREGFDIAEMPQVRKSLSDLRNLPSRDPAALGRRTDIANVLELENFQTIQNRIEKVLTSRRDRPNLAVTVRENTALSHVSNKIDEFLDSRLNSDLIVGDPAALRRWRDFHSRRRTFNEDFNVNKTLRSLIDSEASPEQMQRWLIGASAAGAKPQASSTIRKIRELLGNNHPAMEGIRQDFLFELAQPLIKERPNFNQFIDNYNKTVLNQKSLLTEMGLDLKPLEGLKQFALVAREMPQATWLRTGIGNWEGAMAKYFVGHGLARGQVRINLATSILRRMFGRDKITQKSLLAKLTEAQFEGPAINRNSGAAAAVLQGAFETRLRSILSRTTQGAFIHDFSQQQERLEREAVGQ